MATTAIALQRLYQQRLTHNPFATSGEVVQWLGAVQAQDYTGAKWALGLRMQNGTDEVIERAFTDGTILRTHILRPTWHFVVPTDIRWMLDLTAPRVRARIAHMDRRLELDSDLISRSNTVIVNALRGGKQLTRLELGAALAQAGIALEGLRLLHIIMHAELDAILCSGPRRGKQFTYMLMDERVAQPKTLARDEALAQLIRCYYTGHGPATRHDFVWWSGLTVADARAGLAMVGASLAHEVIDGETYWFAASMPRETDPCQAAFLLPTFDEFLVGFAGFGEARRGGRPPSKNGVFDPPIVIGGQVAGTWRRTFKKGAAVIELGPFAPLAAADHTALDTAIQRYSRFLGMPVTLHHEANR